MVMSLEKARVLMCWKTIWIICIVCKFSYINRIEKLKLLEMPSKRFVWIFRFYKRKDNVWKLYYNISRRTIPFHKCSYIPDDWHIYWKIISKKISKSVTLAPDKFLEVLKFCRFGNLIHLLGLNDVKTQMIQFVTLLVTIIPRIVFSTVELILSTILNISSSSYQWYVCPFLISSTVMVIKLTTIAFLIPGFG